MMRIGRGIEYVRGVSKVMFRKQNAILTTEQRTKDLKLRVKQLLESIPIETIGKCARRARECKLSCLSLLDNNKLNDDKRALRLVDTEKMKKEIKGKRCVLDQDKSIITNLVSLIDEDDDDAHDTIKKEDLYAIKFEKSEPLVEEFGVNKKNES